MPSGRTKSTKSWSSSESGGVEMGTPTGHFIGAASWGYAKVDSLLRWAALVATDAADRQPPEHLCTASRCPLTVTGFYSYYYYCYYNYCYDYNIYIYIHISFNSPRWGFRLPPLPHGPTTCGLTCLTARTDPFHPMPSSVSFQKSLNREYALGCNWNP